MNFQSCGGFHYKFMALSTSSFPPCRIFDGDPPLNFQSLLRENDRDYDAQNFRIFISHHYLPPHLKTKKSMTCCGAHPRCWHGIAPQSVDIFLQIKYQPNIHQGQWYDMRSHDCFFFTEIRHLVEELIAFLYFFGPQKLSILTARLNKSHERGLVCWSMPKKFHSYCENSSLWKTLCWEVWAIMHTSKVSWIRIIVCG